MVTVTRTIHPLPFEHLEPKRFEDLVRQLVYDFRQWRSLEATGRSGSDESFDIRGWEVISNDQPETPGQSDEEEATPPSTGEDRLWLVQCKREKQISPRKLLGYLNDISGEQLKTLHGIIFACASDISKLGRDVFNQWCRKAGIAECYVWSKAEIEDMLFQPKNDGLLFAYFGISLTIRRRKISTELRSRLTTKRKVLGALGDVPHATVLLLDPTNEDYPYLRNKKYEDVSWHVFGTGEYHPWGIIFSTRRFFAYLDDDAIHWDSADIFNDVPWQDPWLDEAPADRHALRNEIYEFWNALPESNRAWIDITALLCFEDIIDVDKTGDTVFRGPIFYVEYQKGKPPFLQLHAKIKSNPVYDKEWKRVVTESREAFLPDTSTNRIERFPARFRKKRED